MIDTKIHSKCSYFLELRPTNDSALKSVECGRREKHVYYELFRSIIGRLGLVSSFRINNTLAYVGHCPGSCPFCPLDKAALILITGSINWYFQIVRRGHSYTAQLLLLIY